MESLCRAFPTNPKEAEAALTELRRSEHAVEVSKIILGEWKRTGRRLRAADRLRSRLRSQRGFERRERAVVRDDPAACAKLLDVVHIRILRISLRTSRNLSYAYYLGIRTLCGRRFPESCCTRHYLPSLGTPG